ncbi:SRPBCC family protein [Phytohabitans houttuyneae]|uniref:Polyketide cyclase n=1 Tax=Phytohabitans houttuyneae TaxID=1076126 RepID=A0A6V8JTX5_9ACTN|nr:SRPBCC family protein [Phytohabitans houttuyneae]GFJ76003.1 polyketide cyclase [Phytohabitans houttuyneae]
MAVVERTVAATPDRVWAVLADGWTYSDWVVGTAHVRDVDPGWPAPGTEIHHKAGPWPVSIHDSTSVISSDDLRELRLRPRLWPLGEAEVVITLTELDPGHTTVRIAEDFRAGPLRGARTKINDLVLHRRNRESLRRLADLAERRVTEKTVLPDF